MRRDLGLRDLGGDVSQLDSWKLTIRDGNDTRAKSASREEQIVDALRSKKYPARQHALKSAKELAVSNGLIYLPGQMTPEYPDSDQGPQFRQRKYFYYITGVDIADCDVTYEIGTSTLILWIPRIEPREALYFGAIPGPQELKRLHDVDDVRYSDHLNDYVRNRCVNQTIYLLHNEGRYRSTRLAPTFQQAMTRVDSTSLKPAMDRARLHKDAHEIALIRRACQISAIGHRIIAQRLLTCSNEREIHALFTGSCIAHAAPAMAYDVIAGAGVNASTLHYNQNNTDLEGNDVVLVDAGCEYKGYASDITRTLPLRGKFEGKAKAIYDIVEEMQEACIAAAKVGKYYYELQVLAADIALDGLLKLGILKGDRETIRWQGTVAAFFPHGLGHHVGLEVHDVDAGLLLGGVPSKSAFGGKRAPMSLESLVGLLTLDTRDAASESRLRMRLEPNMVLTIEPGVYFCRPYIEPWLTSHPEQARFIDRDVLKDYYPVGGVRIEDVLLVTEDGIENLSKDAPKGRELEDVVNGLV